MNELKEKTTARGITLIALVVTIVVLLILAGVSLNLVIGNNGIITKAGETKTAQSHAQVRDAIMLAYGEYQVNMYASSSQQTFLELLQDKGYTDENGTVNVETLLGKKLNLGNGSNDTDVYRVEEVDDNYELNYYEKDGTKTKLDTIAPVGTGNGKITYTQADIDETLKYFTFDETTGVLTTNEDMIGSDYQNKTYPKKVVIPESINGVKVTSLKSLNYYYTNFGLFSHSNVEKVVILAEISEISSNMFYGCRNLSSIELPSSVTSIGKWAFSGCTSLQNVYYTGTEEQWNAITIGYSNDSLTNATKTYNYTAE